VNNNFILEAKMRGKQA